MKLIYSTVFAIGALLFSAGALLVSGGALAHHSFAGVFDMSAVTSFEARVIKLDLLNPHASIYLEVVNDQGVTEEWVVEGPGKLSLVRRGWSDDMFEEGEIIQVFGNPSVNGRPIVWLDKIIMADGTELIDPLVADDLAIEAERRERLRQLAE